MRWATRSGIHIDRAACAWLIRRFIDSAAEFSFINDLSELGLDSIAFDMRGVDLSHHNGDCTFETILRRYDLADPVLWRIAHIVHEADIDDQRFDAPEAPGLDVLLRGLSMTITDAEIVVMATTLFNGLYEYYHRELLLGREPS